MTFAAKSIRNADIYNENFNHYFTEKLNGLTPEQKDKLPNELLYKIFKRGNEASAEALNFNEKTWILSVVFERNVTILIDDDEGLDTKDFVTAIKAQRGKKTNGELLEDLRVHSAFALGNKELMTSMMYIAHVSCSSVYQLVKQNVPNADHARNKKFMEAKTAFNKTLGMLKHYEANTRRITMNYGLTMPEWYALINFAIAEGYAKDFYNRDFKYSYNSNTRNLHKGLKSIALKGYISAKKVGIKDRYTITAKGMELLGRIFSNILLNF
jgi:predicted transcriptional regulator